MSADSHTLCPKCDELELQGLVGVVDSESGSVRENRDYYWERDVNGVLTLVFRYRADCWECGWCYEAELRQPIPAPE